MEDPALPQPPVAKKKPWWWAREFLIVSIAVHLLFGVGAGYFVVSRYTAKRKLTFQAGPKSPNPSERALQHKVQMQQKTQSAPPAVTKRVLTTGLSKVTLPDMPSLPVPKQATQPVMMGAAGATSRLGAATGAPGSAGGTGTGSQINFFGIRDTSSNILIMIDVSNSMFTRTGDAAERSLLKKGKEQAFQAVRDEAIRLVENLTPATRFGIVRWSGGAYSWKPELVAATEENKQAAIQHILEEVDFGRAKPRGRPGGTRHDYALEEAFKLRPETIYMLTDGNATAAQEGGGLAPIEDSEIWKVADEGQKTLTKKAKLHVIYYVTGGEKAEERRMLQGLASRNQGQFRQIDAPGKKEAAEKKRDDRRDNRRDDRDRRRR